MAFLGIVVAWLAYGYVFHWVAPIAVDLLFFNM
jgi:hypothetical protein